MQSDTAFAIADIRQGLNRLPLAFMLAGEDLKDRYRRSSIGILWITFSFLVFLGVKALVFSSFNAGLTPNFLLYLTVGFVIWTYITTMVNGAITAYSSNVTWILSSNLPYSVYFNKAVIRAFMDLGLVALAGALFCAFATTANAAGFLYIVPAAILYALTGFGLCMLLAAPGARFRDLAYAIQTGMRVLFFATPIIWVPTIDPMLGLIAKWNPFFHYIEIVRSPFMDGSVPVLSWLVSTVLTAFILAGGFLVFFRTKRKVPVFL